MPGRTAGPLEGRELDPRGPSGVKDARPPRFPYTPAASP
jgi:hypothetical protein